MKKYFKSILPVVANYAAMAHAGQVRKYSGEAYICHPQQVAGIVASLLPGDAEALVLAYLHDVAEDTDFSLEDISAAFGRDVARGVGFLTKIEYPGMNRAEKLVAYAEQLASAPANVQVVKIADMLSNLSSISVHDPKFGVVYAEEKLLVLSYLSKVPEWIRGHAEVEFIKAKAASEARLVQMALGKKEGKL